MPIYNFLDSWWPGTPAPPTPTSLDLYNAGAEIEGGWSAFAPAWVGSGTYVFLQPSGGSLVYGTNPVSGTAVKNSNSLKIYFRVMDGGETWANTAFGTNNKINVTGWNTLHIYATTAEHSTTPYVQSAYHVFGVTPNKTAPTAGTQTPPGNYKTFGTGETTLDISGLSGNQYVYFGGSLQANFTTIESARHVSLVVTKIWLT